MAVKFPEPALTAARWDLKASCATLLAGEVQAAMRRNQSALDKHYGPQSTRWSATQDALLGGFDVLGLGLPEEVAAHLRAGLALHSILHQVSPGSYAAAALLGRSIDSST